MNAAINSIEDCQCHFGKSTNLKFQIKQVLLVFFLLLFSTVVQSQSFFGDVGNITDNNCPSTNDFDVTVSGIGVLSPTNPIFEVKITINHTYTDDLDIFLIAPDNTSVELSTGNGGSGNNYLGTSFRDSAGTNITSGSAPFAGIFEPEGNLSDFNGSNADGVWKLRICDSAGQDVGNVVSWQLSFGTSDPCINPINPSPSCNAFNVILVLDESGSIGSAEGQVEAATLSLANALIGTGAELAIVEFSTTSQIGSYGGFTNWNTVDQTYYNALAANLPGSYNSGGWTNWEAALDDVLTLNDIQTADIVLFMTDGNPTACVTCGLNPSGSNTATYLNAALDEACEVKQDGSHIFMLGVGSSISIPNLQAISGPILDDGPGDPTLTPLTSDYNLIGAGDLTQCFLDIALNSCNNDLSLEKTVYPGHDGGVSCEGSKTIPSPSNGQVTYCFTISNDGDQTISNIDFSDLDIGIDENDLTPPFQTTLTSGQSITYYYETTFPQNQVFPFNNTADVTGETPTGDPLSDTSSAEVTEPLCDQTATCNLQDINDEACEIPAAFTDPAEVFTGIEACGAAVTIDHTDIGDTDVCGDGTGASFVRTYTLYFDGQAFETCEQNITITDTTDPTFDNQICGSSDASASAYDDGWQTGDDDGSGFQAWNLNTNAGSPANGGFFAASSTNNGDGDSNVDGDIDSSGRALGIYANNGSSSIANRQLLSPMILGSVLEVELDNGFINSGGTVEFRLVTDINSTLWEFGFVSGNSNYNIRSFDGTSVIISDSGIPFSDEGIKIEIIQLQLGSINPIITDLGSGTVYDLGVSELIVPTGEQPIIKGFRYINSNAGSGSTNDVFINNMEICHPEIPSEITLNCDDPIPTAIAPPVSDNCDSSPNVSINETTQQGDCNTNTVITRTWTATDACGNSSQFVQTINVLPDTEDPTFDTQPSAISDISCNDALPAQETLTASDTCGNATVVPSIDSYTVDVCNGYQITYRWTATDDCGNDAETTVTFNILPDTEDPTFDTQPSAISDISCNDALPAQETLTASDTCGNATVVPSIDSYTVDVCNGYQITYRWTATDDCGNDAETTVTFNVLPDTQAPVLNDPAPLADISCSDALPAQETLTAADDCSAVTVTPSVDPFTPDVCNGYSITYRWTAIDACGNQSSKTVTFNVLPDTTPPVITCPADALNLEAGPNLDTTPGALGTATATDNCSGVVSITFSDSDGDTNCSGTSIIRTWTATDACGNSSSCDQIITTGDDTPPEITCPPSVDLECVEGLDTSPAAQGTATATDSNDPNPVITFNDVTTAGDCAGDYVITRTWTATDNCGNASSCEQTITVSDTIAPDAPTPPADADVQCASDVPAQVKLTATDACQGDISVDPTVETIDGNCPNSYTLIRTWTFTDECGNSSSVSQTINVNDTIAPEAPAAPADADVQCASDVPAPVDLTATDNCDGPITASPVVVTTPGNCPNSFTEVRTWTFTDGCGNSSSVSQTINVNDTIAPEAPAAPADADVQCASDVPAPVDLTATDNCDGPITASPVIVTTPGNCPNSFTEVRTWTFTDDCGNSSSVSQTINVNDTMAPSLPSAPGSTAICDGDDIPAPQDLEAFDNCDGVIIVSPVETTVAIQNGYQIIREWTAVDACGNASDIETQIITVNDLPEVDIDDVDPLCIDAEPIQLVGTPAGGTWSGNGVDENGLFDPSIAGVGDSVITYSYTDGGGDQDCDALVLTAVFDGDLSGGLPKGVELFALHDIPDLSIYSLGSANNGGGSDGEEYTFPAVPLDEGDFIYVTTNADAFTSWFGFAPDFVEGSAVNINGDDAIELFKNGEVIDTYGVIDVNGDNQPWDYTDSWAYRNASTGPDGSTYVEASWTYGGRSAWDGETSNINPNSTMPIGSYITEVCSDCSGGGTGCTNSDEITITVNPLPTIQAAAPVCDELDNFGTYSVVVTVSDGTVSSAYTNTDQGNNQWLVSDIPNGENSTITVTNEFDCESSIEVEAPECICIELVLNPIDVTCFGLDDGLILVDFVSEGASVTVNGEPYNPDTLYGPGLYTVMAFYEGNDIDECIITEVVEIVEPDLVELEVSSTNISCFGANDGTITIDFLSDGAFYTIKENGIGPDLSGQSTFGPGTYIVEANLVQNSGSRLSGTGMNDIKSRTYNPCEAVVIVTIIEPELLTCEIIRPFGKKPIACNDVSNHNIFVEVTGGTPPYTYDWDVHQYSESNNWDIIGDDSGSSINLQPGTGSGLYLLTITDANGCETYCKTKLISDCDEESVKGNFGRLSFNMYPNPSSGFTNIDLSEKDNGKSTIEVFNVVGTKVFSKTYDNLKSDKLQIELADLPSQVYYVKISTAKGTEIKKLILDKD